MFGGHYYLGPPARKEIVPEKYRFPASFNPGVGEVYEWNEEVKDCFGLMGWAVNNWWHARYELQWFEELHPRYRYGGYDAYAKLDIERNMQRLCRLRGDLLYGRKIKGLGGQALPIPAELNRCVSNIVGPPSADLSMLIPLEESKSAVVLAASAVDEAATAAEDLSINKVASVDISSIEKPAGDSDEQKGSLVDSTSSVVPVMGVAAALAMVDHTTTAAEDTSTPKASDEHMSASMEKPALDNDEVDKRELLDEIDKVKTVDSMSALVPVMGVSAVVVDYATDTSTYKVVSVEDTSACMEKPAVDNDEVKTVDNDEGKKSNLVDEREKAVNGFDKVKTLDEATVPVVYE